jgi:hypothetical protein
VHGDVSRAAGDPGTVSSVGGEIARRRNGGLLFDVGGELERLDRNESDFNDVGMIVDDVDARRPMDDERRVELTRLGEEPEAIESMDDLLLDGREM